MVPVVDRLTHFTWSPLKNGLGGDILQSFIKYLKLI